MKKKATPRSAKASSRQPTLNFPTSSGADVVAEPAAAETSTQSGAKKRRKRTADFADDTDKNNRSHCDSSAISAQSAVKSQTLAPTDSWSNCEGTKEDCRWPVIPLGELAADERNAITDGPFGSKLKTDHYTEVGPRVIRLKNIGDTEFVDAKAHISEAHFATLQKHRVFPGDIVIAALGEDPPRSCLVPEHLGPAIVKADCIRFKAGPRILPKFINYVLNAPDLRRYAKAIVHGVGRPRLNLGEIKALPIPVPPLPEQHRIVAEIEKQFTQLDAGVAALRRVQVNLKRYRAAVLKAACEGRLVPTEAELRKDEGRRMKDENNRSKSAAASSSCISHTSSFESGEALLARILTERRQNWQGRGKYKEPAAPDTTNLSPLPEGWTWASVEQLLREKLCNGISVKGSDKPPGVRALRLSAMSNSGFNYSDARYLPLSESNVEDLWIQEGDFFMSRGNGSLHLVGRGTSAQKPPQPTIFPDTMIRLRLSDAVRTSGWMRTLWPSRIVRSQIETKVKTTAGIYKIAQPQVEGMQVPLPPLAEQTRIVAEVERRLSVVEELEVVVSANLQRATRLRQSILQKAFTGELV